MIHGPGWQCETITIIGAVSKTGTLVGCTLVGFVALHMVYFISTAHTTGLLPNFSRYLHCANALGKPQTSHFSFA
jgi:hypothetical protein